MAPPDPNADLLLIRNQLLLQRPTSVLSFHFFSFTWRICFARRYRYCPPRMKGFDTVLIRFGTIQEIPGCKLLKMVGAAGLEPATSCV